MISIFALFNVELEHAFTKQLEYGLCLGSYVSFPSFPHA